MDLQSRKLELIQEFLKVQSEDVISKLEDILKKNKGYPDKAISPMSAEELNVRIERSIEDAKNGKLTESSDLKTEIDQWK
jgi:hypothetical protein